ncbi:MAG: hypothetical protein ACLUSP_02830 [Christensenellales bacterium]
MSIKMGKPLELGLCGLVIVGDTSERGDNPAFKLSPLVRKIIRAFLVASTDGKSAKSHRTRQ